MEHRGFHLAQLNVAHARAPLEDPSMRRFLAQLEPVYAAAERARGFVWRLKHDDRRARRFPSHPGGDPRLFVTLSVWESVEELQDYVYGERAHSAPLRDRAEWFEEREGPAYVLWWIPRDTRPRVEQGLARLKYLKLHGPTPRAFTFKDRFTPPEENEADDATQ